MSTKSKPTIKAREEQKASMLQEFWRGTPPTCKLTRDEQQVNNLRDACGRADHESRYHKGRPFLVVTEATRAQDSSGYYHPIPAKDYKPSLWRPDKWTVVYATLPVA